ncbi:hypothetical protein EMCRGX_G005084 [Ephydatia muelleri]
MRRLARAMAKGDIFYGGIQPNIPGNGGPDCVAFLSKGQLLFETLLGTALVVLFSLCGAKTYTLPAKVASAGKEPLFKKVLLVVLSVVFAIEIVYKVCSRQLLYLLNPCHVCTVLEIYLLLSKPRRIAFAVLRFLVHYIYGAAIALLFPETDSRLLPGEVFNYWLQHIIIFFIVPPYLIYTWGPDCLEPFSEWAWCFFANVVFTVHHSYIMTPLALLTHVNLNYLPMSG